MDSQTSETTQTLREWMDQPYRRDEQFLMIPHEGDLPDTCIRLLTEITGNLCLRDCEHFDGDYRGWAQSVQNELSHHPKGVLFLTKLNSQPEDIQRSLVVFWLRSAAANTEQRLAFSFTRVDHTTAHLRRFNVAMPLFERRAVI